MRINDWCSLRNIWITILVVGLGGLAHPIRAQIALDGTLGPETTLQGPHYRVTGDLGQRRGGNLFHSFRRFDVRAGESVTFSGPAAVSNVLGRVTGGSASFIDGQLRSEILGANLYLINPAGLVFGAGASLDVSGSFHATTANVVHLADGGRFDTDPTTESVLTTAAPESFGFVRREPAPLSLRGGVLAVPEAETLSLIGGNLDVAGGQVLAPGGRITIASVASPGEIVPGLEGEKHGPRMNGFERLGEIELSGSSVVNAGGNGGGTVFVRGGRFFVVDRSLVQASARGPTDGTLVERSGAGIDVDVTGTVVMDSQAVFDSNVLPGVAHDSGGVRIKSEHLFIAGGSTINAVVFPPNPDASVIEGGLGNSGDIEIDANSVTISDGGFIRVNTGGSGDAGDIRITADRVELLDGGQMFSLAFDGSGDGGDIHIAAETLRMVNVNAPDVFNIITTQSFENAAGKTGDVDIVAGSLHMEGDLVAISAPTLGDGAGGSIDLNIEDDAFIKGSDAHPFDTGIFATAFGGGDAGNIRFTAGSLEMMNNASFQTTTFGSGAAGDIDIAVRNNALLSGSDDHPFDTGVATITRGGGDGGDIRFTAGSLEMVHNAHFSSSTFGSGAAGDIDVTIESDARFSGTNQSPFATGVFAITSDAGDAGEVRFSAGSVELVQYASLQSSTFGRGDAGRITLTSDALEIRNASFIGSGSFGEAVGNAGEIQIDTDRLLISGLETSSDPFGTEFTGISTFASLAGGNAGNIRIESEALTMASRASIESSSLGAGRGGRIDLRAHRLDILEGSGIRASAFGSGDGGDIRVQAGQVVVDGVHPEPFTDGTGSDSLAISGIAAQAGLNGGDAGSIDLEVGSLELLDGGRITSETFGPGQGGSIEVEADRVGVSGVNVTLRRFLAAQGIESDDAQGIAASGILVGSNAFFLGDGATGSGGVMALRVGDLRLEHGGSLSSTTTGPGRGGDIEVVSDRTALSEGAFIASESRGSGDAGSIALIAREHYHSDGARVSAEALSAGGGNVSVRGRDLRLSHGSSVSASVRRGRASGGNVSLAATTLLALDDSDITARADTGLGGRITIDAEVFLRGVDVDLDASSNVVGNAGVVEVNAPDLDISGSLSGLPGAFLDAGGLLPARCGTRAAGTSGRFVVAGDVPAPGPDAWLTGSYPDAVRTTLGRESASRGHPVQPGGEGMPSRRCHQ